jgi:hypothetical protein
MAAENAQLGHRTQYTLLLCELVPRFAQGRVRAEL